MFYLGNKLSSLTFLASPLLLRLVLWGLVLHRLAMLGLIPGLFIFHRLRLLGLISHWLIFRRLIFRLTWRLFMFCRLMPGRLISRLAWGLFMFHRLIPGWFISHP